MSVLDTVPKCRQAFLRLTGTLDDDAALTELGEAQNEVVDLFLTRGVRLAQRWMLKMGYKGWRKRFGPITWSGSDETVGGRFVNLPTDFLRAFGRDRESALREANGEQWGFEIDTDTEHWKGDYYYFRGGDDLADVPGQLWITRNATLPTTIYLEYHYLHDAFANGITLDFPVEARWLIIAEAANLAKEENWLPGGQEMEQKIERALIRAREEARDIARPSKQVRKMRRVVRYGNRW